MLDENKIMRTYTRAWIPGGTFFFTVNLAERYENSLLIDKIHLLRRAFEKVQLSYPFTIDAIVVLPEHLHCIWRLPKGDDRFDMRWQLIKSAFSKSLIADENVSASRIRRRERGVWQRRYWEHAIRNEEDWQNHVDYIHYNPVKHGYVTRAVDWTHSSFHRYMDKGIYTKDWAPQSNEEMN